MPFESAGLAKLRKIAAEIVACGCNVCGAPVHNPPVLARILAGSKGDDLAAPLCWVCRRLYFSVKTEAVAMRAHWEKIEAAWIE